MNLDIKPRIDELESGALRVTASHEVTEMMWEVLHNCDGIYSACPYSMEHPQKMPTQFVFTPNAGFSREQVMSMVAAGTYISAVFKYDELAKFWSVPLTKHYGRIEEKVIFEFKDEVDRELAQFVISEWVFERACVALQNHYNSMIGYRSFISKAFTRDRLDIAYAAQNRLKYLPTAERSIAYPSDWKEVEAMIKLLENDHNAVMSIQPIIDSLRAAADKSVKDFDQLLEDRKKSEWKIQEQRFEDLRTVWENALKVISDNAETMTDITKDFNTTRGAENLRMILRLCPAVPVSKK